MSNIQISNLSFQYEGSFDTIFDQVNLHLDTTWKLGFIGRNGRGKTTFLKILAGQLPYKGEIHASVPMLYFPYAVHGEQRTQMAIEVAQTVNPLAEDWEIIRELTLLHFDIEHLYLQYQQLSNGEQTKLLLASLFAGEARFLLIDEPTNHLDDEAREAVSHYLQQKSGFILVSHDRKLLDSCIDHVLALNKANIELQQGNFSSWYENKRRQEQFEIQQNESLKKEIKRLDQSARQKAGWSDQVEATKIGHGVADRGFVGHKAAKMMKRSKVQEARMNQAIEDKKKLLKNVEEVEQLTLPILDFPKKRMIYVENLNIYFNQHALYENPVSFEVNQGDRVLIAGKNGSGKSSLLKVLLGQHSQYKGKVEISPQLMVGYVAQDASQISGTFKEFAQDQHLDVTHFLMLLRKLGFAREQFEKNLSDLSAGQKKKVLLAAVLCQPCHMYIFDEPLNYIDLESRMQIEAMLLASKATIIFVEHDEVFQDKIATKRIEL